MGWILAAGGVLLALCCVYMRSEYEKKHFVADTYEIRSEKLSGEKRTFVFLSDLHDNCFGEGQRELLEAIGRERPDAVFIGGDMMVTDSKKNEVDTETALHLVRCLAEKYPVYYGLGNHESRMAWKKNRFGGAYEEYMEALREAGVMIVSGKERYLIGTDISVAGLELPEQYYEKIRPQPMTCEEIGEQLGEADNKRYQILLAHAPSMFRQYQAWGADLTLSGHFHGGTIRIPALGGLMTPQFEFFHPYCGGMTEENGRSMIVSRGLGTHSVNIRLNNRPQLVVIKLS